MHAVSEPSWRNTRDRLSLAQKSAANGFCRCHLASSSRGSANRNAGFARAVPNGLRKASELRLGIVRCVASGRRTRIRRFRRGSFRVRDSAAAGLFTRQPLPTLPKIAVTGEVIPLAAFAKVDPFRLFGCAASPVSMLDSKVCGTRRRVSQLARCGTLSVHRDRLRRTVSSVMLRARHASPRWPHN